MVNIMISSLEWMHIADLSMLLILSQVVRSSLLPGMLKTMGSNKDAPRPLKVCLFTLLSVCVVIYLQVQASMNLRN